MALNEGNGVVVLLRIIEMDICYGAVAMQVGMAMKIWKRDNVGGMWMGDGR